MTMKPILIVDDEPQNLELLNRILQADYPLVFAKSGEKALKAATKHHPSLILLDVEMPGLNGYEVCDILKNNPKTADIPVIFITSNFQMREEMRGFEVGAADYIIKPVIPEIVRLRVKNHLSLVRAGLLERSYKDAIKMLSIAGHYNDTDTGLHIWRMAAYAKFLATKAGLPPEECDLIELAAPMHDTGKIGISDTILSKPGKLDAAEWEIMKTHPKIGYQILSSSSARVFEIAADIALHHHERWDGSGYPEGLKGHEISLASRIVTIADVFDALTSRRPYKDPWPLEKAFHYLRDNAGTQFDPDFVVIFCTYPNEIEAIRETYKDESNT
jgi:putative two-component system response regulator